MASSNTTVAASLQVIRKFKAPAALYIPSKYKGGGWDEISGQDPSLGGQAIIQVQKNVAATAELQPRDGRFIPVVRFVMRHGKDVVNAQIVRGLPILREQSKQVLFKSASVSTGGLDRKTVFRVVFETVDDADRFVECWLVQNGTHPPNPDDGGSEQGEAERASVEEEEEDDDEEEDDEEKKSQSNDVEARADFDRSPYDESDKGKQGDGDRSNVPNGPVEECDDEAQEDKEEEEEEESSIEDAEVEADFGYCPTSQNWMEAFEDESDEEE